MIKKTKLSLYILLVVIISLSVLTVNVFAETDETEEAEVTSEEGTETENAEDSETSEETEAVVEEVVDVEAINDNLPWEGNYEVIAENDNYILEADSETGHFIVRNKETDYEIKSFPEPDAWDEELVANVWQANLLSPFMFSYVQLNERRDVVIESNLINNEANIEFELIDNGYKITYELPNFGFVFPIEVTLGEDFVETRVLADDIEDVREYEDPEDDPMARLVSLRLFPFLGANDSSDKDGYLFLPDGPGVLVNFKDNRASTNNYFRERIYGQDQAFSVRRDESNRLPVRMPVFGIKANEQAFLGIVHEGDTYANITSAPSETFSNYNWATGEHLFRFMYWQPTNRDRSEGYFTYSPDMQRTERSIRYYMIEEEDPDYVDMATRYRQYLHEEKGVERLEVEDELITLQLNLLGGGVSEGFIFDSYLPLTTIDQSMEIIDQLENLGVEDMAVTYHGWQRGGYGSYGGLFPVARQLGGNDKMAELAEYADAKGYALYLDGSQYTYNNTGRDRFRANRDGLRDLSSSVITGRKSQDNTTIVSPLFMQNVIYNDLEEVQELGVDGFLFGDNIGSRLSSDYNERYFAQRHEIRDSQQAILNRTREELGDVHVTSANFYTLPEVSHIEQMDKDYSYDLYADETIPFAQIATHGLVSYSFSYGNMSGNATENFLKGIEYGAVPSYLVTHEESHRLLEIESMRNFYSTNFKDWEDEIARQYQLFNTALADVQDQFIVDHQELAPGVFETTYENGKQIIVNYNSGPYIDDLIEVGAEDFTVIEGGE